MPIFILKPQLLEAAPGPGGTDKIHRGLQDDSPLLVSVTREGGAILSQPGEYRCEGKRMASPWGQAHPHSGAAERPWTETSKKWLSTIIVEKDPGALGDQDHNVDSPNKYLMARGVSLPELQRGPAGTSSVTRDGASLLRGSENRTLSHSLGSFFLGPPPFTYAGAVTNSP